MPNRDEELEQLKKLSPYSLPDNPSQSGWTSKQVKAKFYQGLFYLYDLIDGDRSLIENVETTLDNLNLDDFVTEEEAQAIKNDAMPHIGETPPSLDKTKIWFDTTGEDEVIDVEELESVSENEQTQTRGNPIIFNEYFEQLLLNDNDDGVVLGEQQETGTLLQDSNDDSEILLN